MYLSIYNEEQLCKVLENKKITNISIEYDIKYIPEDVKHLKKLEIYTDLFRLPSFHLLKNLKKLDVSCNGILQLPPLDSLTRLEELWIDSNKITQLPSIDTLENLYELLVDDNCLGKLPEHINTVHKSTYSNTYPRWLNYTDLVKKRYK